MGQVLHGCATTTEAVRRAIQDSQESLRTLTACTRVVQSVEYELRTGNYLSFADLPGLGESRVWDDEYLKLYRNILKKSDVAVTVWSPSRTWTRTVR